MITRRLGSSGLQVSALGVGCWGIGGPATNLGLPIGWGPIDDNDALTGLHRAYDYGITLFDVADVYGHGRAERTLGHFVAHIPRNTVVLTSKVGYFPGTAAHGYHPLHMRHQLEQTLDNLRTDHLDIYFLHHPDFGDNDTYLTPALEAMREFRDQGLIRAIGIRGPHRHALDRLGGATTGSKYQRFRHLFDLIHPDILAVRDNLLTPQSRAGIFRLAENHDCGILITKPLAQGLLTGSHDPTRPRRYGPADHRSRKRWFTPECVAIITNGLEQLRHLTGPDPSDLIRLALWSCLQRSPNAAVLVGFTRADHITTNMTCLSDPLPPHTIDRARHIMAAVQQQLDATGPVFTDEPPSKEAHHG